jgi:hypothetical protein
MKNVKGKDIIIKRIEAPGLVIMALWLASCGGRTTSPAETATAPSEESTATVSVQPLADRETKNEIQQTVGRRPFGKLVPHWVRTGGESAKYPEALYIVGFAMAVGDDAIESAKAGAAGDLANRIQVRVEHELNDVSVEKDGVTSYQIASITRTTSDIRLRGIDYEIYQEKDRCYALAFVSKKDAVRERRTLRDRALEETRACLANARVRQQAGDEANAVQIFETCRKPIAEALEHDVLVRVVSDDARDDQAFYKEILNATQTINTRIADILRRPAGSVRQAADALAIQLKRQGTSLDSQWVFSPLTYGTTNFSSPFGQQMALDLEGAVARLGRTGETAATTETDDLAVRGVFTEEGEKVRISVTVKSVHSGKLAASAETLLLKTAIPTNLPVKPRNFDRALSEGRLLAEGELITGQLRLEIWCDKGRRGAVYRESDSMNLFLRVNQPAYVRLVYVLENGAQIPIDQGYYIDSSKVNMAVEYPDEFEVVPPFGIEHVHATAFTKKPPPLPTTERLIDGMPYEVVAEGFQSMVRHRGIARKSKDEVAETMLSITTMPYPH